MAFDMLPKRDKDRLAYHYEKGTTILCGRGPDHNGYDWWKDGAA